VIPSCLGIGTHRSAVVVALSTLFSLSSVSAQAPQPEGQVAPIVAPGPVLPSAPPAEPLPTSAPAPSALAPASPGTVPAPAATVVVPTPGSVVVPEPGSVVEPAPAGTIPPSSQGAPNGAPPSASASGGPNVIALGPAGHTTTTISHGEVELRREAPRDPAKPEEPKKDTPWYEKIKIRGYTQFRYSRIPGVNRNDDLKNSQGDRFLGRDNGFGIRRARVIIYGDVHERVSIYLQPDFASVIGDQLNVAIMRDWYADLFLTKDKTLRVRVGQSKVPYGFENLQSSQNRLALDRGDSLNSAVKDERDLGIFMYWAPKEIRDRFKHLVDSGLKGSGDYGVVGIGVYNGQTANRLAANDNMHGIGRVTWPFKFGEQFVEVGGGGYFGRYRTTIEPMKGFFAPEKDIKDARAFASLIVYPQPFGFQAEGTFGTGPSLGEFETRKVESRRLFGGYAQLMYKIDDLIGTEALIPFVRANYYEGGKKFDTNAPKHIVKELEIGVEWQLIKALEVVAAYDMAHRQVFQEKNYDEKGHVGRVQLQFNY